MILSGGVPRQKVPDSPGSTNEINAVIIQLQDTDCIFRSISVARFLICLVFSWTLESVILHPGVLHKVKDLPSLLADEPSSVSQVAGPDENQSRMVHQILVEQLTVREPVTNEFRGQARREQAVKAHQPGLL